MTAQFKNMPLNQQARALPSEELAEYGNFPPATHAWIWEDVDQNDSDWYPQGITSFERDGQYLALVSWYFKPSGSEHNKVRITYLERHQADGNFAYGHAYLAGPDSRMHAGGIAFRHSSLLVADTNYGVVSFDALNPECRNGEWQLDQKGKCGLASAISDAKKRSFSFVDIDWTDPDDTKLLSGVYASITQQNENKRYPAVFSWKFANKVPVSRGMEEHLGLPHETNSQYSNMQGVAKHGNVWYYSQSGSKQSIRREIEGSDPADIVTNCYGLEDLHITRTGNYLMGLTEHPGTRIVFQIDLRELTSSA